MVDFNEEQEAEIQKRIEEARKREQYRLSVDQAYKESIIHLNSMVDQFDPGTGQLIKRGIYDPYILEAFQNEYRGFLAEYFPPKPVTAKPEEPAPAGDES